jgi:hypothetical protein
MKKILLITIALAALSSFAFAYGTLESSWLDGSNKICKYSDGSILTIGMSEMCPVSN